MADQPAADMRAGELGEVHRADSDEDADTETAYHTADVEHAATDCQYTAPFRSRLVHTHANAAAPPCSAPPITASRAPSWMLRLRPNAVADHMMKREPMAPPAL